MNIIFFQFQLFGPIIPAIKRIIKIAENKSSTDLSKEMLFIWGKMSFFTKHLHFSCSCVTNPCVFAGLLFLVNKFTMNPVKMAIPNNTN